MPLGSGALAGHAFFGKKSRALLAKDLGFSGGPSWNSLDATSDRDFVIEFLFWGALTSAHLSRWSEDVIIYSSREFGYIRLSDAYSTGSSLMPQKKNPDASELLRGKTGRTYGNLISLLTTFKGLPMTYNKDMQEDKEALFDTVDTLKSCLPIANGVMATLVTNPKNMHRNLSSDMLATDLADYLVRKGVPFRETHHISGQAVKLADDANKPLSSLTLDELRGLHKKFEEDVHRVWSFENSVESRDAQGSTSHRAVLEQIEMFKEWLNDYKKSE
jgi:argininosuccinate lyase